MFFGIKTASGCINGSHLFTEEGDAKRFVRVAREIYGEPAWEVFPLSDLTFAEIARVYVGYASEFYLRASSMARR